MHSSAVILDVEQCVGATQNRGRSQWLLRPMVFCQGWYRNQFELEEATSCASAAPARRNPQHVRVRDCGGLCFSFQTNFNHRHVFHIYIKTEQRLTGSSAPRYRHLLPTSFSTHIRSWVWWSWRKRCCRSLRGTGSETCCWGTGKLTTGKKPVQTSDIYIFNCLFFTLKTLLSIW